LIRRYQTIADYVAIGLAPLLIFWMINSLAGFLMLVLYQGNYPARVIWILMCYTMGATALARVTIEQSRSYSSMYGAALGVTTFLVLLRFVGDPIFAAGILFTIGYLADRIVHDCTIIDDGIDSSGQGLVDSGRKWIARQWEERSQNPSIENNAATPNAKTTDKKARDKKSIGKQGHQPGRTVLYLAFAALPLFGIGQFFLRGNPDAWERARWMLVFYLFSSLSLLVVTSFLNLRRYLRQRQTEMPVKVTVTWLVGGIAMILFILLFAFLAPLPGRTLVSLEMPEFLSNRDATSGSRKGWGEEGADGPGKGAPPAGAPRPDAETPSDAPELPTQTQSGAPPGGDSGDRDEGPTGKDSGGKKPAEKSADSDSPPESSDGSKPQGEEEGKKSEGKKSEGNENEGNENEGEKNDSKKDEGEKNPSQPQPDSAEKSNKDNDAKNADPKNADAKDNSAKNDDAKNDDTKGKSQDKTKPENETPDSKSESESKPPESKQSQPEQSATEPPPPESPPPQPESSTDWSGMLSGLAGLIKFLLMIALLAIIAAYVYLNRDRLMAWYRNLFGGGAEDDIDAPSVTRQNAPEINRRPFSSFANPVGTAEAGEVVVVTFQALEAWGREQGVPRNDDETPNEFARRLTTQFPNLRRSAPQVVDAYNRVVYGRAIANTDDVTAASSVWQIIRPQL